MNYRHAFHAGNHADVLKHVVLLAWLDRLLAKETPVFVLDTHGGRGEYALDDGSAARTGEAAAGIGRLWGRADLPQAVAEYVDVVRGLNPDGRLRLYPGSPWIASRLMRPQDRLRLFELHTTDAGLLRLSFAELGRQVRIEAADGFEGLKAVLPPPPRRGLILIDPAYEVKTDYRQVIATLKAGMERFATGIFAVWYPQIPRHKARELPERLRRLSATRWLHVTLSVRAVSADGHGMHGSGLFMVNPPWSLADTLGGVLPWLTRVLGQDDRACYGLDTHTP